MPTLANEITGYRIYGIVKDFVIETLCPACAARRNWPGITKEIIMADELDVVANCDRCEEELS